MMYRYVSIGSWVSKSQNFLHHVVQNEPQWSDDTDDCRFSAVGTSGENMLIVGLQRNGPLRFVVTDDGDAGNLIMTGLHSA
jgi:hypothetical protein